MLLPLPATADAPAIVVPARNQRFYAPVEAIVTAMPAHAGRAVREGDLLIAWPRNRSASASACSPPPRPCCARNCGRSVSAKTKRGHCGSSGRLLFPGGNRSRLLYWLRGWWSLLLRESGA